MLSVFGPLRFQGLQKAPGLRTHSAVSAMTVRKYKVVLFSLICILYLSLPATTLAEQLPIKTYTTTDGLAQDNILRIVRDSHGFMWFCTGEGLSRFDGYQFTSYTADQGLPHASVNDLLETRQGAYWVATGDGLCRLNTTGTTRFTIDYPGDIRRSRQIRVLCEDNQGVIWCGTEAGLFQIEDVSGRVMFHPVDLPSPVEPAGPHVQALLEDRQGSLWIGTREGGLYRRWPDGSIEHYLTSDSPSKLGPIALPADSIEALLQDRNGQIWAGTTEGLCQIAINQQSNRPELLRVYALKDGLKTPLVETVFQSVDGHIWLGDGGLGELAPSADGSGQVLHTYTTANGLSSYYVKTLADDRDGNLWIGTDSGGAMKLARGGFTTYTEEDGLATPGADAIFQDRAGELCVVSSGTRHFINSFDSARFDPVWPDFPKAITRFGWGSNQITFQDHTGQWWVPTAQGLCRFPAVGHVKELANTSPLAVYTARDGLPFNEVFRLYEDRHGDIWISTISVHANGLTRWSRATQRMQTFTEADGLTSLKEHPVAAFREDARGNLWIGHWGGGLTRFSAGTFTYFGPNDGLPAGTIRTIFLDHSGRLWLASALGGLSTVDDPSAAYPAFVNYGTNQGLSSNDVWCITEDQWGRIYVGTGRGLDRLEPDTGRIKHYTAADGLMRGKVTAAFRDSRNVLWFGSNVHGLSRFIPRPDPPRAAPPVLIRAVKIAGVEYSLSQLGEAEIPKIELGPNQNQITIDFVGIGFGPGELLRYQYRLEGADDNWSAPGLERVVNYGSLAPGSYRFVVRAIDDGGLTSERPASLSFTILPPIWRRWWFIGILACLVIAVIYAAHRGRVARLLELERVRTRIATDLHDDIGANLSLIAMVSEVATGQSDQLDPKMKEWFSTIASTSRDTVDAMSDIVWAVNPQRDHLTELTHRMRRFAEDILGARDIVITFRAPDPGRDFRIGADLRREIFLIFKEGINNTVRHSESTRVEVELWVAGGWLTLQVKDNGCGFDASEACQGNGLPNMRSRAKRLGGTLQICSSPNGAGTALTLRIPLGTRARF